MNFYTKQLENEKKYIENKYFFSLIKDKISDVIREDDFIVKKVTLNETLYKMYIKKSKDFDILFIPETSNNKFNFINDFDNIIRYKKTNDEIHFSVISKKDNYINLVDYLFFANENGYSSGNYFHNSFYDKNYVLESKFLKRNTSTPNFLYDLNIRNLIDLGYHLERIKRNRNETKVNKINENSLLKAYQLYNLRFTKINDDDSPMLSIFEKIHEKEYVKTKF